MKALPRSPRAVGPSPVPRPAVSASRYDPRHNDVPGGTMRRHATAAVLLAATLALTSCSTTDSEPDKPTKTATATVTATPKLSRDETKRQCSVAIAEAAPGWEDWNYSPGEWADDPRTPDVCQGLVDEENPPRGNRDFMSALLDGLDTADDPRAEQ